MYDDKILDNDDSKKSNENEQEIFSTPKIKNTSLKMTKAPSRIIT